MLSSNKSEDYCSINSTGVPSYLTELERETHLKTINPRMLSGQLQGRLLSLISRLVKPEKILEIGTFTGYAALCLAEGLVPGGTLDTIELNPEMKSIIQKYIRLSPFRNQIHLHMGNALTLLDRLAGPYDLAFIDANKESYQDYYEKIIDKIKPGGLILADNVLWNGKVYLEPDDETARKLNKFNRHVLHDDRVENLILPIRDGLSLIRRKI